MKTKLIVFLASFITTLGMIMPSVAEAWWYRDGYYRDGYRHNRYYYGYGPRVKCKWVGGHWRYGRWIPGHRVCWRR